MNTFEIEFTRRHISRSRAKRDVFFVVGKTPASAARYLMRRLRKNTQGVYSLVSVAPRDNSDAFLPFVKRARKAARKYSSNEDKREVFAATARGATRSPAPVMPRR